MARTDAVSLPRAGGLLARSPRLLAPLGDERLVEQLRRGNETAFEVIYDRHHRGILSFCRHMLGTREEAEDAVQQTFISAYDDLRSSDKEIRLKPWLYTIARNRSLTMLRARRESAAELGELSTAGFTEEVQQRTDLKELLADLRELPDDQRESLVLSELGDLSHADVAQIVGCDVAKVKSLVYQARSALIERRAARETPCEEIREQIATLRGGALRRGPLRRHIGSCPGCAEFRDDVKRQRAMMAVVLPVIPTVGLRESALAAVGITGGGGLGGGGGLIAGLTARVGVSKVAAVAVVTGAATLAGGTGMLYGGGGGAERDGSGARSGTGGASTRQPSPSAPAAAPAAGRGHARGDRRRARRRGGDDAVLLNRGPGPGTAPGVTLGGGPGTPLAGGITVGAPEGGGAFSGGPPYGTGPGGSGGGSGGYGPVGGGQGPVVGGPGPVVVGGRGGPTGNNGVRDHGQGRGRGRGRGVGRDGIR